LEDPTATVMDSLLVMVMDVLWVLVMDGLLELVMDVLLELVLDLERDEMMVIRLDAEKDEKRDFEMVMMWGSLFVPCRSRMQYLLPFARFLLRWFP